MNQEKQTEEQQQIEIILSQSTNAKDFKISNIIHRTKFENIKGKIQFFLENETDNKYSHNTITLLGTRGSGKTSFLLSLEQELRQNPKLEVLNIIDPTLIEEKAHVFLNLISIICDKVDSKFRKNECNQDKNFGEKRKFWRSLVTELAAGLPSIDGVTNHSELKWENPEYVMENELRLVKSARKLADNFVEFLSYSLEILGKKAFLLFFDDIDVDSSKGYAVLETIRKYFITGKIITILSGDLRLYNTLIRQKKWSNFGVEILKFEGSSNYSRKTGERNMLYYNNMVTDLTSQYLLKIMQPQYRYHLGTLYELMNSARSPLINIKVSENDYSKELLQVLKEMFGSLGIKNKVQLDSQVHFLLNQPLRTIIHFLQQIVQINGGNVNISEHFDVLSILLTDLYEKHVNVELLTNSPLFLNIEIIKLLIKEQQLKELYQLSPTSDDNSLNASVFAFNVIFSQSVKKYKFLIFDYLVRVSFLRNIIDYYPNGFTLNSGIVKTSGVQNDLVLRDVMNQLQVSFFGISDKKDSNSTLIRLKGLKGSAKKSGMEDSLDAVLGDANINSINRVLGYIPSLAGNYTSNNNSRVFYSIYNLLSCVGELLKRYEINRNVDAVLTSLIEFSQLRYYTIDDNDVPTESINISSSFENNPIEDKFLNPHDLADYASLLEEWIESYKFTNISVHLLGKSFTRFFIAVSNINDGNRTESLGRLFHLNILGFLNSILVEDVRENLPADLIGQVFINQNNIATSEKILIDNLKALRLVEKDEESNLYPLSLSQWIFSCPLLLSYIDSNQTELINCISEFTGVNQIDARFKVYEVLKNVKTFSTQQKVPNPKKITVSKNWKSDNTLGHEKNFGELLKNLSEEKIDIKELFANQPNDYQTGKMNKIIMRDFPLFGSKQSAVDKIKKFRKFLELKGLI
ncbi:P-loop NTPase fold protein [Sphingobacterium sp.]|uniref:P-loop NTPase fold protein n=1 Tax=Sphingobacterium sp. TaxID=341027 RepID=UPI0028A2CCF6|nr:P-loop NTPase fold protein [Sphingobacterium sp.]